MRLLASPVQIVQFQSQVALDFLTSLVPACVTIRNWGLLGFLHMNAAITNDE